MTTGLSRHLLVAAAPDRAGARSVVSDALGDGGVVTSVLLTGEGLAWLADDALVASAREGRVSLCLCSRSARDRKVNPVTVPAHVQWSSLAAWLREMPPKSELWSLFP